ncbi:MAG: TonB-dependent receptor [Chitinophagaceae bacterium]
MIKYLLHKKIPLAFIIFFITSNVYGLYDTTKQETYDDLSLKDLLNIKIVSVSKKPEWLFDAPLSASVITKDDIRKAGSTSIMEALRLVPGMIAREQNNGNYDIHIRGMDNVPPNAPFDGNATTTLVMIDNRPIYNYLKGGTFWETLPVDLNDIEKIEVVRGPAAALYGPNAVSGVINIITRQPQKEGLYLVANAKQGGNQSFINNASVGYQSNKWNMVASGNYQHRNRTQTSYFEMYRNRWIDHPAFFIGLLGNTLLNINEMYPNPALAMQKYAGNIFLNFVPSEKTRFNLKTGAQHSVVQTVSTENGVTPFTTVLSDSKYVDLRAAIKGITAQVSYNQGTQKTNSGAQNKYYFCTFDANAEYNYIRDNFSLKPGLSYRSAIYDDTKYSGISLKNGYFNSRGIITTLSASLRGEYNSFKDKLRLVAGFSANKFNYPDSTYISYQLAATTPDAPRDAIQPNPALNNIYSGLGITVAVKSTPVIFGGAVINYLLTKKLNGNMSAYYYSNQTYFHVSNVAFHDGIRGIEHINAKLIMNVNLSYEPVKSMIVSCSSKNILNNISREFFKADDVPFMLLAGINYEF